MGESLEIRATPGASLLGLLVGAPLADALFGSYWDDFSPFSPPASVGSAASARARVDGLLELRHDQTAMDAFFGGMRDMLDRAADGGVEARYVEAARDRIDRAVDALMDPHSDFSSGALMREMTALDGLFAAIAFSCKLRAQEVNAELPLAATSPEVGMMMESYNPDNHAPTPQPDSYSVLHDHSLQIPASGVLANDSDPDGDSLSVSLLAGPAHAAWFQLNADGSFYYWSTGYAGSDGFSYQVTDGQDTADSYVSIDVTNQPPAPQDDTYTTSHTTSLVVASPGVMHNDSDPDGDVLSFSMVSGPSHAQYFSAGSDGSFTYYPQLYAGPDSFTYEVNDGVCSRPATVTIDVTNQTPVAGGASISVMHGQSCTIDVGSLSSDGDGDPLEVFIVGWPASGASVSVSGGTVSYTPPSNFAGSDSFTYQVYDGIAYSDPATVSVTVLNTPPTAGSGSLTTLHDHSAGSWLTGSDADGDSLTWSIVSGASHGSVQFDGGNSSSSGTVNYTYTPYYHYVGDDNFTFTVTDGIATSDPATVSISVTNNAPSANGGSATTSHRDALSYPSPTVSDPDYDPVTAVLTSGPSHAQSFQLNTDGSFSYVPDGHFAGDDSFNYYATDDIENSPSATFTITVTNNPPLANADGPYETDVLTPVPISVLGNDTDADGDTLKVGTYSQPSRGSVSVQADGSFLYTPSGDYVGPDSFTYCANDGIADGNSTTVSINVSPAQASVTASDPGAAEAGLDTGEFLISLSGVAISPITVNYSMGGNATPGTDYTAPGSSVTIGSGSSTATVTVSPVDDDLYDPSETVVLSLQAGTVYVVGSPSSATVTIDDDDNLVSIAPATLTIGENGPAATFAVSRLGPATESLSVSFTVGGTALPDDYTVDSSSPATIPAGQASTSVVVTPVNDTQDEDNQTVTLTLSPGAHYQVSDTQGSAMATIADDDIVVEAGADQTVNVGDTVSLSGSQFTDLGAVGTHTATVDWGDGGGAQPATGVDEGNGSISASHAYTASGVYTVAVSVTGNTLDGGTSSGSDDLQVRVKPVVTILTTDDQCSEQFEDEGVFTVYTSSPVAQDLTVQYSVDATAPDSATNGVDYASLSGSVVVPAGSNHAEIIVHPIPDDLDEGTETVMVTLTPSGDYSLGGASQASLDLEDYVQVEAGIEQQGGEGGAGRGDSMSAPGMAMALAGAPMAAGASQNLSLAVLENVGALPCWVYLFRAGHPEIPYYVPADASFSFHAYTNAGTAVAPGDFGAVDQVFAILPGTCGTAFSIPIVDDALAETDETFTVGVDNPSGFTFVGPTAADVTILDNDGGPRVIGLAPGAGVPSLSAIEVTFSKPINPGTFGAGDISISGPVGAVSVTGVTQVSSNVFAVTVPEQWYVGQYQVVVGPGVEDLDGNEMDQDGDSVCGEAEDAYVGALEVTNTAPSNVEVTAAPSPVDEGSAVTLSGHFSDPNPSDTHTVTIDWGDGSSGGPVDLSPGVFALPAGITHAYTQSPLAAVYTMTVTITDNHDGSGQGSADVVVTNVPPTVTLSSPQSSVDEGLPLPYTLNITVTDPGNDLDGGWWSIAWGDGNSESGVAPVPASRSHYYGDGYGEVTVSVSVADSSGALTVATQTVTVYNQAPTMTVAGDQTAEKDVPLSIPALATIEDPGFHSATPYFAREGGLSYSINWGDGTAADIGTIPGAPPNGPTQVTLPGTHTYNNSGNYTVTVTAMDNNGDSASGSFHVSVGPALTMTVPSTTLPSTLDILEAQTAVVTGDITNAGTSSLALTVSWGEGPSESLLLAPGATSFAVSHRYADDNPTNTPWDNYSVSLALVSGDGRTAAGSVTVKVTNVAPAVRLTRLGGGPADPTAITLRARVTDPGKQDTFTYNWTLTEDGQPVTWQANSSNDAITFHPSSGVSLQHYYAAVTVADDDQGSGNDANTVDNIPADGGDHSPQPEDDTAYTGYNYAVTVFVLNNDTHPDNYTMTITAVTQALNGTVSFDSTSVTYTPSSSFVSGADNFTYTVDDAHGHSANASVTINMVAVTDCTLESRQADGSWAVVPGEGPAWAGDQLRWSARYAPKDPPTATSVDWLIKSWSDAGDPGVPWSALGSALGDAPVEANPGVGDWAVEPSYQFTALAGQTDFCATPPAPVRKVVAGPVMNPFKVSGGAANGELTGNEKQTVGAYVPVNDDEDGVEGTKDMLTRADASGNFPPISPRDDDLLKIVLHKINPPVAGGNYWLSGMAGGIRVWAKEDRTGEVTAVNTFSAAADTELYVEGRAEGSCQLALNFTDAAGTVHQKVDWIKVNVFTLDGPIYVPEHGTFDYAATGGAPGNGATQWPAPTGGTLVSTDRWVGVDFATIKWNAGPQVGILKYQAAPNYSWNRNVYVVQVKVESPDGEPAFKTGTPFDAGTYRTYRNGVGKLVESGNVDLAPGLEWVAKVTVNGPPGSRGVRQMRIGFVQNATLTSETGFYQSGSILTSSIEGQTYLDTGPNSTADPYYSTANDARFWNPDPGRNQKAIRAADTPSMGAPLWYTCDPSSPQDPLVSMAPIQDFRLFVTAQTDDRRNGADAVFTALAEADWMFNASGSIDTPGLSPYPWSASDAAGVTAPETWTLVAGDVRPIISGQTANDALKTQTWH